MGSSISGLVSDNSAQEASHDVVGEGDTSAQNDTIPFVEHSQPNTSEASEMKDVESSTVPSNHEQPYEDRKKTSKPSQANDNQVAEELSADGSDQKEEITQVKPRKSASRKAVPNKLNIDPTNGNKDADETGSSLPKQSLNSSKSLKSAERPASACVKWDEIDWESLGADSDPLNINLDSLMNRKKQKTNKALTDSNGTTEISHEQINTVPMETQQNSDIKTKDGKGETTSSESASNVLENSGTSGRSVPNLSEENATLGDKDLDTPAAATNTDGGDQGGPTNKENMPIGSGQETETKSLATPATRTDPNEGYNEDMSHSAGPSAGAPAGEDLGSEKRQYSADRPASARIDRESLDASSNPLSLNGNDQKSETSEKMEQSSEGQAELVMKPVENSASKDAESIPAKMEGRVKATGGMLTEISKATEHAKSGQDCGIRHVSLVENFDQSLAEKDQVKIDLELVFESAPAVDKHSPKRETGRSPPSPQDYRSENLACGEPKDVNTSRTTHTTEQKLEFSPPLPRGEYTVDWKNLNEFSDPSGGKLTKSLPKDSEDKSSPGTDGAEDQDSKYSNKKTGKTSQKKTTLRTDNKDPNIQNPETETTVEKVSDTAPRADEKNLLEQTTLSPPLPGGEYKIDFDNLDEYSDPFGGKMTNKVAKPSAPKSNDPGKESKDQKIDEASGSSKIGSAPKAKKMQEESENPTTENPVQEKSNTGSTNDAEKPGEQTELSPPLPRGEYKLDFDNLDEYSDPFGGKVINMMTRPSVPKPKDVGEESKSPRDDKSSKPRKVEGTPKEKGKQSKTNNRESENPVKEKINTALTNDAKKSEEQTVESPPLPRGEYKLDFDNLDEYSDPFGGKVTNTMTKPSVPKPKDVGEGAKSPRDDKSSNSTKVEGAPKGKAKQPNTKNPKTETESADQEKTNIDSTNDAEKSEEQTVESPPLPRGEYKLDFDNLDEYSDPFGGKVTSTTTNPSVPKSEDVSEETEAERGDKTSKSTKVEGAPKGKAKQPNTKNPKSGTPVQSQSNLASTNGAERSEEQTELSPPLPRGEYKIDFDNLDEYSDPFGGKVTNTMTKPSMAKFKDVGEETKSSRDDKSSKSAKVESAPKGKAKQPNTKNPKTEAESALQEKCNKTSTIGVERSEEQTELSPPLPRGEYKIDFDNLDEYSDPFGGKVTNTTTKPSVAKFKDVGEETKSPRDDKSSKSAKVESAPKGKAKQPNTTKRTPELLATNTTGSSQKERLKNATMDDRPLKGGGAYNIDWDAVNEMADPFDKDSSTAPTKAPVKVDSKGDCPADSPNAVNRSPAKSGFKPATPVRTSSVPKPPTSVPPSDQSSPMRNGTGPAANSTGNSSAQNGFSHEEEDLPSKPTLSGNTAPTNPDWPDATQVSEPSDTSYTQPTPGDQAVHPNQVLTKIDSSTRPASPAQPLLHRPSMDDELDSSARFDTPVTESEVMALRKERDELVKTIDEM
ncbi:hypothetical protein CRM22_000832, partial [Opisthorchis felineus]